jgi:hypothetical protein
MLKDTPLRPSKAPNLPIAPVEYNQQYVDQLTNALRLYFGQVDNYTQGLVGDTGGKYLTFPHIAAYDTTTQYATGNNTPTLIKYNTLAASASFTLNLDGTATVAQKGTYKITYSLQLANNENTQIDVFVWLRINGVNAPASTTIFTLPARKSAGVSTYVCGYSEVVFKMNSGDNVALWWGTPTAATSGGGLGTYILYQGAQTSPMAYPSVPSAIGSITFVSAT